jgi:hypothetical protein
MPSKKKKNSSKSKSKSESDIELNSYELESKSESGSTTDESNESNESNKSNKSNESDESDDSQIYSKYSDIYSDNDDKDDKDDKDKDQDPNKKSVFLENVIKYLETDNIIYKKKKKYDEEIKVLKEDKTSLEALIIKYLNEINNDCVEIKGQGKLTKTISEKKSAINNQNITEAIAEIVKKEKLVERDEDTIELINKIMETIDSKRVVTKKEFLKRTREPKKKQKTQTKKK